MKAIKVILILLICILTLASVSVAGIYSYNYVRCAEFYSSAEDEGKIPGISDGFVPEGYCAVPDGVAVSGHMNESGAARIYLIKKDGEISYTNLIREDGKPFISRASGIEFYKKYLYVTGSEGLYMFYYEDLLEKLPEAEYYGVIDTHITPEWCEIFDRRLYVGSNSDKTENIPSFQKVKYGTEEFTDLIMVYEIDPGVKYCINDSPLCIIASPSGVEGMFASNSGYALTRTESSYLSYLDFYVLEIGEVGSVVLNDSIEGARQIPCYYFSETARTYRMKIPAGSQDTVSFNSRLYFVNLSGSDGIYVGRLLGLDRFLSIPLYKKYYK